MRLIDRDYVLSEIAEYADHPNEDLVNHIALAFDIICEAPPIDAVEVVRGEWIVRKERTIVRDNDVIDFFPTEYECSNCGLREAHYFINSTPHNYCPNCGANMKGADDVVE